MSSFKHNPYQQFSPPQPSSWGQSATSRRAALPPPPPPQGPAPEAPAPPPPPPPLQKSSTSVDGSQRHHSAVITRTHVHSSPSGSTPVSPPSGSNSFALSRDVSSVSGGTRGETETVTPPLSSTARSSVQLRTAPQPQPPYRRSSLEPTPSTAPLSTVVHAFAGMTMTGPPPPPPPLQQRDASSSWTSANSFGASAYTEPARTMENSGSCSGDFTTPPSGLSAGGAATPSMAIPDSLATTLFIDGLPPTIENQHQLSPFVPPQGRVKVRVKRSRGRDVGFAVYDSVDAASAALEWFHTIRMIKEMVQTSGHAVQPGYGGTVPVIPPRALQPVTEPRAATSYAGLLPVSYDDYLLTRHNTVLYTQLLRQSISLRVEWAHAHETQHLPQPLSAPPPPSLQPTSVGYAADAAATGSHYISLHSPPPPPPPPLSFSSSHEVQRLYAEECTAAAPPSSPGLSTYRPASSAGPVALTHPSNAQISERWEAELESTAHAAYDAPVLSYTHTSPGQPSTTTTTVAAPPPSSEASLRLTSTPPLQPLSRGGRGDRRLPSRTLFVKLIHNFPLPPSLARPPPIVDVAPCGGLPGPSAAVQVGVDAAVMTAEDRAFFALAQRVCREEFFSEQFAGVVRYRPFLHPPYYGGCFVLFERDTDMQRCLQWMRGDGRLMTLFAVQPARNDTFER